MTRRFLSIAALLMAAAAQLQAQVGPVNFFAELRGTNEVPATNSPAIGAALVTLDANNVIAYEVSITGMAGTPSLSHIHENVAGLNGQVVVNFAASPAAFQNGRVSGTVQADPEVANRIRNNPQTFYVNVHSSAFPDGEIRGQLLGANEDHFAVAGNITTGAGDKFVTDLRIFNPTRNRIIALVEFFTRRADAIAVASKPIEIGPKGEAVLDDVVGPGFLNATNQLGALRVTSATSIAPTMNIYNDQRSANKGTLGQFVPAVPLGGAFPHGAIPHLSNRDRDLSNPQGFRTNIGFFNPSRSAADVNLTLRDSGGNVLGTQALQLGAMSQLQLAMTLWFPSVDLSNVAAVTLEYDSTQPILAFGAVNDNVSGDSIYVPAQSVPNIN